MLQVKDLHVMYGGIRALDGISLNVHEGQIVALLGANGAGKSSTLRAITGIVKARQGSIRFKGEELIGLKPHQIVRRGIAMVPEGRRVFTNLTVAENLLLSALHPQEQAEIQADLETIFELFPRLAERRSQSAGTLSGGEQQMLALGRARMSTALLLIDEPSLGLAPVLCRGGVQELKRLNEESGQTILLIEQNARAALSIADYAYILETGNIVLEGPARELAQMDECASHIWGCISGLPTATVRTTHDGHSRPDLSRRRRWPSASGCSTGRRASLSRRWPIWPPGDQEETEFLTREALAMYPGANILSPRVQRLLGSVVASRASEGHPGAKYQTGLRWAEEAEVLAAELICRVFGAKYAEVRALSGSMANMAVLNSLTEPGDTIFSLSTPVGGHISHAKIGAAGYRWLDIHAIPYDAHNWEIKLDELRAEVHAHPPKLIIVGASLILFEYPLREIRAIADEVGAWVLYDAAHVAGLIAGGAWQHRCGRRACDDGQHLQELRRAAGWHRADRRRRDRQGRGPGDLPRHDGQLPHEPHGGAGRRGGGDAGVWA